MLHLALILHVFLGSTLAGAAVVLALVLGVSSAQLIVIFGVIGFVLSFPASWLIARAILSGGRGS